MNPSIQNALFGLFFGIELSNQTQEKDLAGKNVVELKTIFKDFFEVKKLASNLAKTHQNLLEKIVEIPDDFFKHIDEMDAIIEANDDLMPFGELIFDLWVLHLLETQDGDFLESQTWLKIEEETLDRGTEAMNFFLYLQEAKDEGLEVNLSDFLYNFLLVDDADFQEEHQLYEPIIAHQDLIDEPFKTIISTGEKLAHGSELEDLLVPIFCFFKKPNDCETNLLSIVQANKNLEDILPISASFLFYWKLEKMV